MEMLINAKKNLHNFILKIRPLMDGNDVQRDTMLLKILSIKIRQFMDGNDGTQVVLGAKSAD